MNQSENNQTETQESNQTEPQENHLDNQDLDDWSKKYDITLTILSQEYYEYINLIKQVDEKTNKYLVVVSIFIAGFFTVITSSLTDRLNFNINPLINFLSSCFVFCVVICSIYGFLVIKGFLKSLEYVRSVRLPNLEQELHNTGLLNYVEYQNKLIQHYQDAITLLHQVRIDKQKELQYSIEKVPSFLLLMTLSIMILFVIKLVSK